MTNEHLIKIIQEYYKTTHIDTLYVVEYVNRAYMLGYLDGYMNEEIYKPIIEKEEGIIAYDKGYKRGENRRNQSSIEEYKENKEYFIFKLASFDALDDSIERNISDDAIDMYNSYKLKKRKRT